MISGHKTIMSDPVIDILCNAVKVAILDLKSTIGGKVQKFRQSYHMASDLETSTEDL